MLCAEDLYFVPELCVCVHSDEGICRQQRYLVQDASFFLSAEHGQVEGEFVGELH